MRASVTLATADSPGSVRTMCATLGSPVRRSSSVRASVRSSRSGWTVVSGAGTGPRLRGRAVAAPVGQHGEALGHVVEVVDRVVDQVAGERRDGEDGAVAAVAGALPGVPGDPVEPGGQ